jgi:hypothetical protein
VPGPATLTNLKKAGFAGFVVPDFIFAVAGRREG